MADSMKGQFYVLSAFIVAMYIFFVLQMFLTTETSFVVPDIPEMGYIHEAVQDSINAGDDLTAILDAVSFIPEPIGVRCNSIATDKGTCSLEPEEWACGVNVTVNYRGNLDIEITETIFTENFDLPTTRTPIYLLSNDTGNFIKTSRSVSFSQGTIKDTAGRTIKGKWSGSTATFRVNLAKNSPRVVYVYHILAANYPLLEDVGILKETGYDSAVLYNKIYGKRDVENITYGDIEKLENGGGPRMLFLPAAYPAAYGSELKEYVEEGGILVAPYGLCSTSGSCLVGNIESVGGSYNIVALNEFDSLNPVTSDSDYYTNPDISWIVYNSTVTNSSRAAIGAEAHGEGYVVFVGNESMLSTWNQLDEFLTLLLDWGVNPVTVTEYTCPDQSP